MSFESLPPEIVEQVVVSLPLHDIGSVRLTSQTLAFKVTQEHYKSNFYSQKFELTSRRLKQFVAVAASDGLLEANVRDSAISQPLWDEDGIIQEITLFAIEGEDPRRIQVDLSTLSQQRDHHAQFYQSRRSHCTAQPGFWQFEEAHIELSLLTAEVIVYRVDVNTGGGWKHIWAAANTAFATIFASTADTGLKDPEAEFLQQ
ncbi:hypothetical protein CERZMDRAFT_97291 [Cercospora zeae-maydis SCOH1-5]|uniref:F-box domain-containing protein n=1 Tax=Cercospora zeae-maydis SCOH1-5 TaxID=717836 RepID=A0A6A6FHD8_9PEZI|nr:hypothetical protein CERZMDRAFT_97291 [Cercospora zeae-maydis SCOH1-5]